ncbi:MAG: 2-amino-4-hydroxy-6-hydroxymethyldihydropteridine diphosphokinase [Rhizobiaceae bacterium]
MSVHKAWLGLGGNIGDVRSSMNLALDRLDAVEGIHILAVSALYATPPWGVVDQPDFLNACVTLETTLTARELLHECLEAERSLKRERKERWGPRTIDIDILAMEGVELRSDALTLPHPRMHERAFVLMPLADIAPDLFIFGKTVAHWLEGADKQSITRLASGEEWRASRR